MILYAYMFGCGMVLGIGVGAFQFALWATNQLKEDEAKQ